MRDGELTLMNEAAVLADANREAARLRERAMM
jgi:hypothetical protein